MNYKDLIGKKMKVTPEQSKRVQLWVFENGGTWRNGFTGFEKLTYRYLFFHPNGFTTSLNTLYFNDSVFEEISYTVFEELIAESKMMPRDEGISISDCIGAIKKEFKILSNKIIEDDSFENMAKLTEKQYKLLYACMHLSKYLDQTK